MEQSNKIKLILAGTGHFSSQIFESLILNKNFEVIALISQPNKAYDRNNNLIKTEVAKLAEKYHIKLFQPAKIKEIYDDLSKLDFDFFMTAAFGQFIPNSILNLAKKASINVHGSLLNNEKETGISLIYMIDKMDAGDIINVAKIKIEENDTALEIFDKLAKLAIDNLPTWLINIYNNNIFPRKQDESLATLAPKIQNEEAQLFLTDSCDKALAKIKAFNDQPGAFILINGKRLKIFRATKSKISTPLTLNFANGKLYLIEYQFEGKKKVKHEI